MTVSANPAVSGIPAWVDSPYITVHAISTANIINPGDYVGFSATGAAAMEDAQAYYKASGAGIALDRNPAYDWAGRQVVNSALLVGIRGIFNVTAAFSGRPLNGVLAYPVTTGSAVNAPSGVTGAAATWQTAAPTQISANPTALPNPGVAQVIGWGNGANAGTGELLIRLWDRNPDYF